MVHKDINIFNILISYKIDISGKVNQEQILALLDAVDSDDKQEIENSMSDRDTEFALVGTIVASMII